MPAVVVGQEVDRRAVGRELRGAGPPVEVRGELGGGATGHVDEQQRVVRRLGVGGQPLADAHERGAVGGEARGVDVGQGVVDERPRLAGRGVGQHDPGAPSGRAVRNVLGACDQPSVGGQREVVAGAVRRTRLGRQVPQRGRVRRAAGRVVVGGQLTGPEEVRDGRTQVVVPVPDRIGLVQDRGDAGVLALRAPLLVGLGVGCPGHRRRGHHHVRAVGGDREPGDARRAGSGPRGPRRRRPGGSTAPAWGRRPPSRPGRAGRR